MASRLPDDMWREIIGWMFQPDVPACRGIYRIQQTSRRFSRLGRDVLGAVSTQRPLLIPINPAEYVSAEIYLGGAPENLIDDKMSLLGLVIHFEWFNDRDLSVGLWRSIAGKAATNVVSISIDMHYHEQKTRVITTTVGIRGIGLAESLSFGFTSNTEGGFTIVTLNTSEVISISHEMNPIMDYVEITSHSDLVGKNIMLLDDRSMTQKIIDLFRDIMPEHCRDLSDRCIITPALSTEFDMLGMTTQEDFQRMMRIINDISADNGMSPYHAFLALLRDKKWILDR